MQHLVGRRLPAIALVATDGRHIDPVGIPATCVIFCYPWTGRPGMPNPPDWDRIEGAHGSTPQARAYAALYGRFTALGVAVFGLSLQDTDYQAEFASRCVLPFALLSDHEGGFSHGLGLPTFETGGRRYLRRLTLIARAGAIAHIRYPVAAPEGDAAETLSWLESR